MTRVLQELAAFQPQIEELVTAREHTDVYGKKHTIPGTREAHQNHFDYEDAKRAEKKVTHALVDAINAAPTDTLTEPQQAIAVKVLAHPWRYPMPKNMKLIREGFTVFERVRKGAEKNRGLIAIVGEKTIELYESQGADDIRTRPIDYEYGHHSISYRLDGRQIQIDSIKNTSFPDPVTKEARFSKAGLYGGHGNNVAEMLRTLDPSYARNDLPFIRLGTPEKPGTSLDAHLHSDDELFAARFLVKTLAYDWIRLSRPSEIARNEVVDELSSIYQDLITGETPRDKLKTRSIKLGRGYRSVPLRNKSLADYTPEELQALLYASDASAADVEAATREKVAKLGEGTTAMSIARVVQAQQSLDLFFRRLAEVTEA